LPANNNEPKLNSAPQEFSACLSLNNPCCIPCWTWPVSVSASVLVSVSVSRYRLPACPLPAVSESVRPQARSRGLVMCVCRPPSSHRRLDPFRSRSISHRECGARYSDLRHPTHGRRYGPSLQATAVCTSFFTPPASTHPRRVVVLQQLLCPSMCLHDLPCPSLTIGHQCVFRRAA
jgi:hypothetical protein